MAKEDLLPVEMGKLEIEPARSTKCVKEENPFVKKSQQKLCCSSRSYIQNPKCSCSKNANLISICKKKSNKIIKDPVLRILKTPNTRPDLKDEVNLQSRKFPCPSHHNINSDILSLCSLVDDCNQLRISSDTKKQIMPNSEVSSKSKWWKTDVSQIRQNRKFAVDQSKAGTCSQQALNPPCDITIDELASYFETLVHIPKKMSSMAEMMYI